MSSPSSSPSPSNLGTSNISHGSSGGRGGRGGSGNGGRAGRGRGGRGGRGPRKRSHHDDGNINNNNTEASGRGQGQHQHQQGRLIRISKVLSWALRHGAAELKLNMTPDGFCPVQQIIQHPKYKSMKLTVDEIVKVVETNDKQRFKLEQRPARDYCHYKNEEKQQQQHKKDGGKEDDTGDAAADDATATAVGEGKAVASKDDNDNDDDSLILCIRANQGHSISGGGITIDPHLLLSPISPERLLSNKEFPVIVHGTFLDRWQMIQQSGGLKRMTRHHIHFATGISIPSSDNNIDKNNNGDDNGVVISGMRKSCQVYIYINGRKCARDGIVFFQSDNGVLLTAGKEEETASDNRDKKTTSGMLPIAYFSHVTDNKGNVLLDQRGHDDSHDS